MICDKSANIVRSHRCATGCMAKNLATLASDGPCRKQPVGGGNMTWSGEVKSAAAYRHRQQAASSRSAGKRRGDGRGEGEGKEKEEEEEKQQQQDNAQNAGQVGVHAVYTEPKCGSLMPLRNRRCHSDVTLRACTHAKRQSRVIRDSARDLKGVL